MGVVLPVQILMTLRQLGRGGTECGSDVDHRDAAMAKAAFELAEQNLACR
jgi:hypothetical protein